MCIAQVSYNKYALNPDKVIIETLLTDILSVIINEKYNQSQTKSEHDNTLKNGFQNDGLIHLSFYIVLLLISDFIL